MSEAAKERARVLKEKDPDYFKKMRRKSEEAWIEGGKKPRGLAAVSKEKRAEISRKGVDAKRNS